MIAIVDLKQLTKIYLRYCICLKNFCKNFNEQNEVLHTQCDWIGRFLHLFKAFGNK